MEKENLAKVTFNKRTERNSINKLKRQAIFSTANPWKAIFIMVTPPLIAVIIFSTYQIFDKWIATQWGGQSIIDRYNNYQNSGIMITAEQALKIINIATTYAAVPSSMMVSFALMVATGTGIKFSIAYGQNKREQMSEYLGNGFLLSFLVSIVLMIIMYFSCQSIIEFQAGSDAGSNPVIREIIIKEAVRFSQILILATPLLFFAYFLVSLLRSEGMMLWTILINVAACLVNISLDFIFVIPGKLGMEGTAYATIIAWASINLFSIGIIWYSADNLRFKVAHLKLKWVIVTGILLIGATSLLQNIAQSILAMVTTKILNTLPPPDYHGGGSTGIPVFVQLYGGIMPWLILINAPIIGITQGARALIGYVYGSKDFSRVWQLMWRLTLLLLLLLIGSVLLVVIAGQYMMNFFGVDLEMARFFKVYIIMQFAFYPLATLHYVAVIFYQSINRGKLSLFASLQRTIIMPIICLGLGYYVAHVSHNGFYFYLFLGFIDLFAAFILSPLLIYTFWKSKPFIHTTKDKKTQISNLSEKKVVNKNIID